MFLILLDLDEIESELLTEDENYMRVVDDVDEEYSDQHEGEEDGSIYSHRSSFSREYSRSPSGSLLTHSSSLSGSQTSLGIFLFLHVEIINFYLQHCG